jgi:tartrate dehydrogenase/decarboxylase/D-malate dehydrogenase
LAGRAEPVLVDEWQLAPDVLAFIKAEVDRQPDRGRYIVTGSAAAIYDDALWPGTGRLVGLSMFGLTEREFVTQQAIFSRQGVDRILKFAYELASKRPKKHLTSATKSNGISISMPYWDERVKEMAAKYPQVKTDQYHIDILTAHFVMHPDWFDVVVASNLFGDILSDLGPAATGTIGIAPSANMNPEKKFPSLFEPVHGSAPDIAGKGIANPVGQIWTAAMMLEHLGESEAAQAIEKAVEKSLSDPATRTRDLGGKLGTQECGKAVAALIGSA